MAETKRVKTRYLSINVNEGSFVSRLIRGKQNYNFSDVALLRKILSKEKARILYLLKQKKVKSIYDLAKKLGRDFKSVHDDLKLLERFGFIVFQHSKTGKRSSLIPVLTIDKMEIILNL